MLYFFLLLILVIYIYIDCYLISTVLVLPTPILNSDLISVQRYWQWSVLPAPLRIYLASSSQSISGPTLAFSVVFGEFSKYFEIIKDGQGFPWNYESLFVLHILEALLYFNHCENRIKDILCLTVLTWKYLIAYVVLHWWHPYQKMNHLINSFLLLRFGIWIKYYHSAKSHILWCFQNQQFVK